MSAPGVLDIRRRSATPGVYHIPLESLIFERRFFELSPPDKPLILLADEKELEEVISLFPNEFSFARDIESQKKLESFDQQKAESFDPSHDHDVHRSSGSHKPAVGDEKGRAQRVLSAYMANLGWKNVKVVMSDNELTSASEMTLGVPQGSPLWKPNPMLRYLVKEVGSSNDLSLDTFHLSPTNCDREKNVVVLDVGSGVCRDAVAMCRLGWNVIAIDQREILLEKGRELARRFEIVASRWPSPSTGTLLPDGTPQSSLEFRGFGELVTVKTRISGTSLPEIIGEVLMSKFGRAQPTCVHVSRFFNRPLLPALLETAEKFFAMHHFLVGSARPVAVDKLLEEGELRRLVEEGELRRLVEKERWHVCVDQVVEVEERRASIFVARKFRP